jgi:hypothetical protein
MLRAVRVIALRCRLHATAFRDRHENSHGLNIVEPAEAAGSGAQSAKVVNVANWSDANPNRLEPHEPQPTDVVVTLGSKH